jgi:hypothetical protein
MGRAQYCDTTRGPSRRLASARRGFALLLADAVAETHPDALFPHGQYDAS